MKAMLQQRSRSRCVHASCSSSSSRYHHHQQQQQISAAAAADISSTRLALLHSGHAAAALKPQRVKASCTVAAADDLTIPSALLNDSHVAAALTLWLCSRLARSVAAAITRTTTQALHTRAQLHKHLDTSLQHAARSMATHVHTRNLFSTM
jgi:hypothetical protein